MANKMFSNVINKMVSNFVPQEDTEARITVQGTIVVLTQTPNGKEWVDKDANVYPEEMLSDFPVFTIAKPVAQITVGDVVKLTKSTFATVVAVSDGKVETLSFGGQHRQAKAFKDMFLGQATVRVVVNPLAGVATGDTTNTLMMLSLLDKDSDDKNDLMKTMMITSMLSGAGQNPLGNLAKNPMALMMLMKGDGSSVQDILMLQAMQGGLGNIFGVAANTNEAAAQA
jgi:hypothetical protein